MQCDDNTLTMRLIIDRVLGINYNRLMEMFTRHEPLVFTLVVREQIVHERGDDHIHGEVESIDFRCPKMRCPEQVLECVILRSTEKIMSRARRESVP
jgi:hypothetical protein